MSYDVPTPPNLDAIDESQPLATEDPALFDDALRQTRDIIKNVLLVEHNSDGTHKAAAAESADPNSITGSMLQNSATDDSKRAVGSNHIKDKAIINRHLDDAAVDTEEIADNAIETAKIADGQVTEPKLATDAVSKVKVQSNAIGDAELSSSASVDADRAVGTDHLKDGAVATAKLGDLAVTAAKIANIGNKKIFAGDGVGAQALTVGGDLQLDSIAAGEAIFKITSGTTLAHAILKEPSSDHLATKVQTPNWLERPSGFNVAWSVVSTRISGLIQVSGDNIIFDTGSYWISFRARVFGSGVNFAESAPYCRSVLYDIDQDAVLLSGNTEVNGGWSEGAGIVAFAQPTNVRLRTQEVKAGAGDWYNTAPNGAPWVGDYGALIEVVRTSVEEI